MGGRTSLCVRVWGGGGGGGGGGVISLVVVVDGWLLGSLLRGPLTGTPPESVHVLPIGLLPPKTPGSTLTEPCNAD